MELAQARQQLLAQRQPMGAGKQQWALARGHHLHVARQLPALAQPVELAFQALRVEAARRAVEQRWQGLFEGFGIAQHLQLAQPRRRTPVPAGGERVQHSTTTQGVLGALVT